MVGLSKVFAPLLFIVMTTLAQPSAAQAPDEAQLRELMEQMKGMQTPSEAQMKQIVDQAGAMQECMQGIDRSAFESLGRESESLSNEIKVMCAAGQRDEAQDRAIEFSKRVAASPQLKKMADCSQGMRGLLPSMAALAQRSPDLDAHVCDSR